MKRRKYERARPDEPLRDWCEAGFECCDGRATDRHHVRPRSAGGGHDTDNTRDICRACHRFVHEHPAWAYENDWLRKRTA